MVFFIVSTFDLYNYRPKHTHTHNLVKSHWKTLMIMVPLSYHYFPNFTTPENRSAFATYVLTPTLSAKPLFTRGQ